MRLGNRVFFQTFVTYQDLAKLYSFLLALVLVLERKLAVLSSVDVTLADELAQFVNDYGKIFAKLNA